MERLKETTNVFDTKLYKKDGSPVLNSKIAEDLAGMVLEAGDGPLESRVNPRKLKIKNGVVIDPIDYKNVLESASNDSDLAKKESEAATKFYDLLINGPIGTLIISVSPPEGMSPYKEGRINVGFKVNDEDIEFYGIPTHFSAKECLNWAVHLTEFSDLSILTNNPDDLRNVAIPVNLPENLTPWVFLSNFAPLDSPVWQKINEGAPWERKEEALKDASEIADKISPMIDKAKTEREFVVAGAVGEQDMQNKGWILNALACVGLFNSQLLGNYTTDAFGGIRIIGEGKLVKNCGNCKRSLNMYMKKGDKCPHCPGVYEGC
ncbi:MAG TPA: hypothetical protein VFI61_02940 [Patescibacteria group bacterium]|nr:hypothetical protein [Patescibacteria group bacterium]